MLTDETYALLTGYKVPEGMPAKKYYFAVTLMNQCYWVMGCVIGSLAGEFLPFDKSPPHTRDFSRELGGFSWKNVKHMV